MRAAHAFGLERNIVAVSTAVFLLALGENLWKRFVPKYLEALGAPVTAIGFFGTCQDFLDGVYQYPGRWIGDRYGRRRALLFFVTLAAIGYGLYWWAPTWPFVFAGLVFVMAWSSMASPTLFAVVLVRSLTIAPAAFIGGVLWNVAPALPFWLAGGIGLVGVVVFAATVEERYAS